MKRLSFLFVFLLLYPVVISSQTPFDGCAPEGKRKKTAKNKTGKVPAKEAAMNRMKNRDEVTGSIDHSITIKDLINSPEQTDLDENTAVEITGWIPESEVRRRIRECRAVVMASFAEGLPMVLMEAFALGRVAVATSVAGIPELVRPGQNGWLVPAGDSESLADAMAEVLAATPATLNAMAMAGRDLVLERHNTPTEAAKLEELMYSVTRH